MMVPQADGGHLLASSNTMQVLAIWLLMLECDAMFDKIIVCSL